MAMDKKLKTKWIKALRSGKYKQAVGVLEDVNNKGEVTGNCCLGVLCRVAGTKRKQDGNGYVSFQRGKEVATDVLADNMISAFGLSEEMCDILMAMNDGNDISIPHKTFKGIARWIEKNVPTKKTKKKAA